MFTLRLLLVFATACLLTVACSTPKDSEKTKSGANSQDFTVTVTGVLHQYGSAPGIWYGITDETGTRWRMDDSASSSIYAEQFQKFHGKMVKVQGTHSGYELSIKKLAVKSITIISK